MLLEMRARRSVRRFLGALCWDKSSTLAVDSGTVSVTSFQRPCGSISLIFVFYSKSGNTSLEQRAFTLLSKDVRARQ